MKMGLNKSTGNMYNWVTHTWNVVKGECYHGCAYCYVKKWGKQNPIRFDEKELKTDLGHDNTIFVGSGCDMFADNIPIEWIQKIFRHCCSFDNTYIFQSKNPIRFKDAGFYPEKVRLCTTIETNRYYPEFMGKPYTPIPQIRAYWMSLFSHYRYVTIEPIMDFDMGEMVNLIWRCNPLQVNIGADSNPKKNCLPEPSKEKILELISELEKFTVIHQKNNLKRLLR